MGLVQMISRSGVVASAVAACAISMSAVAFVAWPRHSQAAPETAVATRDFLDSIGVDTSLPDRGQPLANTVQMVRYAGFRWIRGGIEGLTDNGPTTIQTFIDLHQQTGARVSWSLVSGGSDLNKLIATGKILAQAGALLAFEGNNEPNNWGVDYQGEKGGGHADSWRAVAKLQRDLYQAVKTDPALSKYPVWSVSEQGAEADNVGLQFLTIPKGANTLMPDGTRYADFANVHNYIFHGATQTLADNTAWNAADPSSASKVDGLFGNYGFTWGRGYIGYPEGQLYDLPKVTTETGAKVEGAVSEEMHGILLLDMYLDQYKRGYAHTSVYLLRDRTDEGGNQAFGFFRPDYSPRKAAIYLHNFTSILDDRGAVAKTGAVDFDIPGQPNTVHQMLLQSSDRTYKLLVWDERISGEDKIKIDFGVARAGAKIYDPIVGVEPIKTVGPSASIDLTLNDHPLILALSLVRP
jgi:hypothetical protein